MARKARIQYPGALYHVFNRGIDRRNLFWDDRDREYFLECLALGVERFRVEIHVYCLMTNHYHLLVGTPLGNISHFMQSVQTRYGGHFNMRHGRSGYVFQGPYGAKLVEGDEYLLTMSRYIHLNAVRLVRNEGRLLEEVVEELRAYPWSSYREYIGRRKRKDWLSYAAVEAHVREVMGKRRGAYREYVERGLVDTDKELEELLRSAKGMIGTQEFVREVLGKMKGGGDKDVASFRSACMPLAVEEVMDTVLDELGVDHIYLSTRRGSAWARGVVAEMLCRYAGLTQTAAAQELGLGTGASVSIRRKTLAIERAKDKKLDRRLNSIERNLEKKSHESR